MMLVVVARLSFECNVWMGRILSQLLARKGF